MIAETPEGVFLSVKVTPKSSKNQVVGPEGDSLKIKIAAQPVDGEANSELIEFVAKWLKISKSNIQLISGQTNRYKRLYIAGLKAVDITNKLNGQIAFDWDKK